MAFKRLAGASGVISKPLFFREVLGENVPTKLAEVEIPESSLAEFKIEQQLEEFGGVSINYGLKLLFTNPKLPYSIANIPCFWWHE